MGGKGALDYFTIVIGLARGRYNNDVNTCNSCLIVRGESVSADTARFSCIAGYISPVILICGSAQSQYTMNYNKSSILYIYMAT